MYALEIEHMLPKFFLFAEHIHVTINFVAAMSYECMHLTITSTYGMRIMASSTPCLLVYVHVFAVHMRQANLKIIACKHSHTDSKINSRCEGEGDILPSSLFILLRTNPEHR